MHTHSHFSTQTIGGKFVVYKLSINSTNFTNFKLVSALVALAVALEVAAADDDILYCTVLD